MIYKYIISADPSFGVRGSAPRKLLHKIRDDIQNQTKALFFMGSKGDVKAFFGMRFAWQFLRLRFCVTWARILLLFEAFGSGLPRSDFETKVFFAGGNLFLSVSFEWVL